MPDHRPIDVDEYLRRIGVSARPEPSVASLVELQRAHLGSVPFENLDIHLGVPIRLDLDEILAKVVGRRRGGFCYELNGAFAWLLRELGFTVTLLEARVSPPGEPDVAFDHLCLRVDLDEPYLVDVGFGAAFDEPLRLVFDVDQSDPGGSFRIEAPIDGWSSLRRDGEFEYRLSMIARDLVDFEPGCRHHQTSPDSPFTRNTVCTRPTDAGRVTLRGLGLIDTVGSERSESPVRSDELQRVLADRFGVVVSPQEASVLAATAGSGVRVFDTALGRCGVAWRGTRIVAVGLPERSQASMVDRLRTAVGDVPGNAEPPAIVAAGIAAIVDHLEHGMRDLVDVMVDLADVPEFDREVLAVARAIPPGSVLTYGAVARRIGRPNGAQAVGQALGRNPVPVVVPCHRVIASDGDLGGFSAPGGAATKRRLLELEGAPIDRSLF